MVTPQALLRLATEMGSREGAWIRLRVHLSQEDLARMIGARREVTSTLLNQLRTLGCINYAKRGHSHLLVNTAELDHYQHLSSSKVTDKLNVG